MAEFPKPFKAGLKRVSVTSPAIADQNGGTVDDSQWAAQNRGAMASYDAFVQAEGLILEDLRTF